MGIRRNQALQIQADHFQNAIDDTQRQFCDTLDASEQFKLIKRILGLEEAGDSTAGQGLLEELREFQEVDITRLQKLRQWVRDNMTLVSALGTDP